MKASAPPDRTSPNSAIPQALLQQAGGIKRLATETGAGQWVSSLAMACSMFGLECTIYMVKISHQQKPYRKMLMQTWGANVFASPERETLKWPRILKEDPNCPGSLGIASA